MLVTGYQIRTLVPNDRGSYILEGLKWNQI